MSTRRRERGLESRLEALAEAGDHAGARAEAMRALAGAGSTEADREAARGLLRSLQPEGGAVGVGLACLALASAVAAWMLAAG